MHDISRLQPKVAGSAFWQGVQCALFVVLLCLPGVRMAVSGTLFAASSEDEKPPPKPRALRMSETPITPLLEGFAVRFGFRKELVRGHSLLLIRGFGVSGSERTYQGRNGWYFLAKESPKTGPRLALRYARNADPLDIDEAAALCRARETVRERLASQGSHYVFVVAPNKESVYTDLLPFGFERSRPDSRLDQILVALRRSTRVSVIDLRPALQEARKTADVYYKTDSHWNPLGALTAQEVIIGSLSARFPAAKPLTIDNYHLTREARPGGDLARAIGLEQDLWEEAVLLKPRKPVVIRGLDQGAAYEGRNVRPSEEYVTECDGAPLGRAVILRDSFGEALIPFLSPHFKRAVYLWNHPRELPWDRIRRERPDVVIHEVVERSLSSSVPIQR